MNSQDFRNLQEAYLEVYSVDELGEGLRILPREKMKFKAASKRLKATASEIKSKFTTSKGTTERNVVDAKNKRLRLQADKMDKSAAEHTPADAMGKERDNRSRSYGSSNPMGSNEYAERQYAKNRAKLGVKEQYDLYDIILSHLIDEGYADTEDSALVIMANMSEDWRESIVEGAAQNVANRAQKLANQRKGQTSERKAIYQSLANKADERANPKPEADWRTGISDSSRKMNVSTYADRDEVKIKTTNPKKFRKQKAMGEH
jgi:uncharacterized small protein (DUF1192 family)